MPKQKQEATQIIHNLLPFLEDVSIPIINIKVDCCTTKTKPLRGDVWISKEPSNSRSWEKNIIALIEAKDVTTAVGSRDWNLAIKDGKAKAEFQELPFFIVTNTNTNWKYYRTSDLKEITLDGKALSRPVGLYDLDLMSTQVDSKTFNVLTSGVVQQRFYSEKEFLQALYEVKNVYRNCAINNVENKIATTITFVVLKYITEQERIRRTLDKSIMLWDDWRVTNLSRDIRATIEDIQSQSSSYADVASQLKLEEALENEHCEIIIQELGKFQYSGCNFDLYGAVYESFADKKTKKEFGEYYTRRHISKMLSELLLSNELVPRDLKICDVACGTGGFLTEAYRILLRNYTGAGHFTQAVINNLKRNTFSGFDIKSQNIALARINMCLVGDGHTNIQVTKDSLITVQSNKYDYILTNVPYGDYKGSAVMGNFTYANKKRYESLFLEKVTKALKYGGKAVVIIPDGILESPSLNNYRVNFLRDVKVEAVISLHKYVFRPYTTEKTYAIIFQKRQKDQIGEDLDYNVFMYILENDGFQKGDKRYPIRENDIPDLLLNYQKKAGAPHITLNIQKINEDNFHNLTPEFYLGYYEADYKEVEFQEYLEIINRLKSLNKTLENPIVG